jgi:APA family basic amino acid/polyamine antiporter
MILPDSGSAIARHHLPRSLGFWEATAINITQIVGAGVFATIPIILGVLPAAYALLAWLVAGVLILADSMIWGELGAALPAAGGSYHFLLESYGRSRWGRLMAFLFVWQILISGPLEIGSGLVAASQFSKAIHPDYKKFDEEHTREFSLKIEEKTENADEKTIGFAIGPSRLFGFSLGLLMLVLLFRRVTALGKLSLLFLIGVLGTIVWVLIEGMINFNPTLAFDTYLTNNERPKNFGLALGAGMGFAIYSYFGYYNICYLGSEVRDPARTIPRSILVSSLAVVVLFALVHLAIVSVIPWRTALSGDAKDNITAEFMRSIHGEWAVVLVTICLIGSCFASAFSGLLGYSRVPFAAAREGHFFKWFGEVHSRHKIPHRALLLIGVMVLFWSFFSLDAVISALLTTRILEQFLTQVFAVALLRKRQPDRPLPWRMWLYPLPCLVALVGWLYVYCTAEPLFIKIGVGTLLVGIVVFLIWTKSRGDWPFAAVERQTIDIDRRNDGRNA